MGKLLYFFRNRISWIMIGFLVGFRDGFLNVFLTEA